VRQLAFSDLLQTKLQKFKMSKLLQLMLLMLLLQQHFDGGCERANCRTFSNFFTFFNFTVKISF